MASLNARVRRLEEAREPRTPASVSACRIADLERYCDLVEYVRAYGPDATPPAHLTTRNVEEEIRLIEDLRVDSGWQSEEGQEFLQAWERDIGRA